MQLKECLLFVAFEMLLFIFEVSIGKEQVTNIKTRKTFNDKLGVTKRQLNNIMYFSELPFIFTKILYSFAVNSRQLISGM
jgi:hypothetical protein